MASAICERHELLVHRNRTRFLFRAAISLLKRRYERP
jgi:hypothetical protein